ncbi:hypothetical protein OUZ56_029886 [Daphnia magna]|uniref:Uncharacterized protein n=1 Tax=Daphnia magna TaxID=35525 RepID=A0ABR0B842_9CRUS|nr:hypothetical protein OUZ56_029886 [Daphnia magna]
MERNPIMMKKFPFYRLDRVMRYSDKTEIFSSLKLRTGGKGQKQTFLEPQITIKCGPWPLPGIHCGGHFDNAHYLLNQKVYFPTWMENAANPLNAYLKLWLSNTILKIQTQIQLTLKPNQKKKTKTINVNNDNIAKQSNKIGTPATETLLNENESE